MNSDSRRVARGGLSLVECILSACVAIALAVGLGFVPAARGGDRDHDDHDPHGANDFRITTLSSAPHLVSGGLGIDLRSVTH